MIEPPPAQIPDRQQRKGSSASAASTTSGPQCQGSRTRHSSAVGASVPSVRAELVTATSGNYGSPRADRKIPGRIGLMTRIAR
jgi:hypothetical protein